MGTRIRNAYDDEVLRVTGERLREARQKRGLTMRGMADELGVSENTIQNAEIGQTCSLAFLHRLANFYDTTLDDLSPVVTGL